MLSEPSIKGLSRWSAEEAVLRGAQSRVRALWHLSGVHGPQTSHGIEIKSSSARRFLRSVSPKDHTPE
jgi:hypothetical protein